MARIEQTRDTERQLTIHRVIGEMSLDESLAHTQRYNAMGPDFRTLWDFSDGRLPDAQGQSIADLSKDHADAMIEVIERPDRYVAIAAGGLRDFGVLRAWSVFAMSANPHIEWQAFRSLEEALEWLMSKQPPAS